MSERVLVCGGRDFADRALLFKELDEEHEARGIDVVIHGAAKGADTLAGEWAKERGVPVIACPADWERYGAKAGPFRNYEMLREHSPTFVIAFPGGKGTQHMVTIANRAGVPVVVIGRGALSK